MFNQVWTHTHIYIYLHIYIYIYIYLFIYIYIYICKNIYIHIHRHIYIHMHAYISVTHKIEYICFTLYIYSFFVYTVYVCMQLHITITFCVKSFIPAKESLARSLQWLRPDQSCFCFHCFQSTKILLMEKGLHQLGTNHWFQCTIYRKHVEKTSKEVLDFTSTVDTVCNATHHW